MPIAMSAAKLFEFAAESGVDIDQLPMDRSVEQLHSMGSVFVGSVISPQRDDQEFMSCGTRPTATLCPA